MLLVYEIRLLLERIRVLSWGRLSWLNCTNPESDTLMDWTEVDLSTKNLVSFLLFFNVRLARLLISRLNSDI